MGEIGGLFQGVLADGADIHVFHRRVRQFLGIVERGQAVEAIVRHFGDTDVRLARVGISLFGETRLGQNAEERCLAYLRQADNASFHMKSF
jgi:hypothetical protein